MEKMTSFYRRVFNFFCYVCFNAVWPLIIILCVAFTILKAIINIYLKLKHADSFGGILSNETLLYPNDKIEKSVMNTIIIIDIKSTPFKDFISQVKLIMKEKVFDCPDIYPKLTHTISNGTLYSYLMKDDVSVDDCISTVDVTTDATISDSLLKDTLNSVCNRSLPKNNKVLWETVILSKPIKWYVDGHENCNSCYVVVLRFNHAVGDALSLLAVFSDIMRIKEMSSSFHSEIMNLQQKQYAKYSVSTLKKILSIMYVLLIAPTRLLYNQILRREENNMFYTGELASENLFIQKVEHKQELFDMVKKIKSIVPNVTFTDIVLTAISASLETVFKNNYHHSPRFVTSILTALIKPPLRNEKPMPENIFVPAYINFPVRTESKTMLKKLALVKKHKDILMRSWDYQIQYLVTNNLLKTLPKLILKPFVDLHNISIATSNVPGPPKITILNDCSVENVTGFVPTVGRLGASFSLLTYDNKFQLGFSANKALISQEEAQRLVDDVFNKLRLLNDEVQKTYCS